CNYSMLLEHLTHKLVPCTTIPAFSLTNGHNVALPLNPWNQHTHTHTHTPTHTQHTPPHAHTHTHTHRECANTHSLTHTHTSFCNWHKYKHLTAVSVMVTLRHYCQ